MFFRAEESFSSSESEEDDDAVEGWSSYRIDQQFSRKLADNHCTVTETLKRWGVFSFWKSICLEDEIFGDASFFLWGGALAVSFRADIFAMTGLEWILLELKLLPMFHKQGFKIHVYVEVKPNLSFQPPIHLLRKTWCVFLGIFQFLLTMFMPMYSVFRLRKYLGFSL